MTDYLKIIKPKMLVGLIDADLVDGGTRHPNLALMKISGYCKSLECAVELLETYDNTDDFEIVFVSKVFTFSKTPDDLGKRENVYCGGTGFFPDGGPNLPYEIEHHRPDYELYMSYVDRKIAAGRTRAWFADYLDYSIGFTTRGCFRKCSFCVNRKYNNVFRHAQVSEFLDENRPYIYLWDDNFLGYSKWEEILDELEATGKPFQFRQGLDIRLLTDKKAKRLSKVRYAGDFIFAFDHIEERREIERGLKYWRKYTIRGTRLYVLCAYDSQDEKDIENTFERIRILMHYGCLPYIMRYESYKGSRWRRLYVNLARWCNQPQFFKKLSFRQFCEKNQQYHKNSSTKCSAMQSMEEFETEHPEIAKRYFDLRYEETNMLIRHGRKFFGKPSWEVSAEQDAYWMRVKNGELSREEILAAYYDKDLDIVWARAFSGKDYSDETELVFDTICTTSLEEIFAIIAKSDYSEPLTPENIPQFSSIDDVLRCAYPLRLLGDNELVSFDAMGMYLSPDDRKVVSAHRKYGENHGKTASLLDLAYIEKNARKTGFKETPFDEPFDALSSEDKYRMIARLALRIPIVRQMLVNARDHDVTMGDYLETLSTSTQKRRRSNISKLLDLIAAQAESGTTIYRALHNVRREL